METSRFCFLAVGLTSSWRRAGGRATPANFLQDHARNKSRPLGSPIHSQSQQERAKETKRTALKIKAQRNGKRSASRSAPNSRHVQQSSSTGQAKTESWDPPSGVQELRAASEPGPDLFHLSGSLQAARFPALWPYLLRGMHYQLLERPSEQRAGRIWFLSSMPEGLLRPELPSQSYRGQYRGELLPGDRRERRSARRRSGRDGAP